MTEDTRISFHPTQKMGVISNEPAAVQQSHGAQVTTVTPQAPAQLNFTTAEGSPSVKGDIPQATMYIPSLPSTKKSKELDQALRIRCKQLGISLFLRDQTSARSLGFTSAIPGEGKTFLAKLTAEVMAEDNSFPVTLLECNWENPTLSLAYNLAPGPGLSEWLLGRYELSAIRRKITNNLTVIPAGESTQGVTQLLRTFQQRGAHSVLTHPNEILIIDLPPMITTAYGPLAAQLADLLILVVRMGVTPEAFVVEACHYLKDAHMHGVIFNQVTSRIPRWLRRIL